MTSPIAIQLYTLRSEIDELGVEAVLRKLAEIGYIGIEPFPGKDMKQIAALAKELGLQIPSAHMGNPDVEEKLNTGLSDAEALGVEKLVVSWLPPDQYYQSEEGVQQAAQLLNKTYETAKSAGYKLAYHNHDFEFKLLNGKPAYDLLLELLDENILLEVDTYWAKVGGFDPAEVVAKLGNRAPLLHIKDGPADVPASDMTAVGDGVLDFPTIISAGGSHTEWLIVELDRCATDMMEAVEKSYQYLVGQGLAKGNK